MKKKLIDLSRSKTTPVVKKVTTSDNNEPIAIIGVGLRVGEHTALNTLVRDLELGKDFVRDLPESRLRTTEPILRLLGKDVASTEYRKNAYLSEIDTFDNSYFKISPKDAAILNPQQRKFLEVVIHALEDAGYGGDALRSSHTGVFVGAGSTDEYFDYILQSDFDDVNQLFGASAPSMLASRISFYMDFHGPALLVDTACSSGLSALHIAVKSLRGGECDYAIVGSSKMNILPEKIPYDVEILSSDERTHSFDDASDGTGGGEGVVAFLLKPLSKAKKDNDHIYATVIGSASNQDGKALGITTPNVDAQSEVIRSAWKDSKIRPDTIGYIEAHGTGTNLGDPVEIKGITNAFGKYTDKKQFCGIGSIKSYIGHLDDGAGAAGLLMALCSLYYKKMYQIVHFQKPNKKINFGNSPVFPIVETLDWKTKSYPRRAGISSFGLSGTNVHVVLEEAPTLEATKNITKPVIIPFSAKSDEQLSQILYDVEKYLLENPDTELTSIAGTLAFGRGHYTHRVSIIASTTDELLLRLRTLRKSGLVTNSDQMICYGNKESKDEEKISFKSIDKCNDSDLVSIAEKYVYGNSINWQGIYPVSMFTKIPLPGYPFRKNRCWLDFDKRISGEGKNILSLFGDKSNDMFLHTSILKSSEEYIYTLTLSNEEYWLMDNHRIDGDGVLVATAYMEIMAEAAKQIYKSEAFLIRNLKLLSPLTVKDAKPLPVLIKFVKEGKYYEFKIQSKTEKGIWITHAKAELHKIDKKQGNTFDTDELKKRLPNHYTTEDVKDQLENNIVKVDYHWDTLDEVYHSNTEYLAYLSINTKDKEYDSLAIHPPILDAALHANFRHATHVPRGFSEIRVYSLHPESIVCYGTEIENRRFGQTSRDVTIADREGNICMEVHGMQFSDLSSFAVNNHFHQVVFIPRELPDPKDFVYTYLSLFITIDTLPEYLFKQAVKYSSKILDASKTPVNEINKQFHDYDYSDNQYILLYIDATVDYDDRESVKKVEEKILAFVEVVKALSVRIMKKTKLVVICEDRNASEAEIAPLTNAIAAIGSVLHWENNDILVSCVQTNVLESVYLPTEFVDECEISNNVKCIHNGKHFVRRLEPLGITAVEENKLTIKPNSVYLITGGTGGIGLTLAKYMAAFAPYHFVLVDFAKFPVEKNWDSLLNGSNSDKLKQKIRILREIQEFGASLHFFQTDVSDYNAMESLFKDVHRNIGEITGIIHAAGLPGERFLHQHTQDSFRDVIKPKVHGALNLLHVTKEYTPDFLMFCSSFSSIFTSATQSDYSAANAFLDTIIHQFKNIENVYTVNWSAWKEIGMAADIESEDFLDSLTNKEAVSIFETMLQKVSGQYPVGLFNERLTKDMPLSIKPVSDYFGKNESKIETTKLLKHVTITGKEDSDYTETEQQVANIWGSILGYETLGLFDNFYDLGGDSINAMRITNDIAKFTGVSISIAEFLSNVTISELAGYIDKKGKTANEKEVPELLENENEFPLTNHQKYIYYLEKVSNGVINYSIYESITLDKKYSVEEIESALKKIVERHDVFKTTFVEVNNDIRQIIADSVDLNFTVVSEESTIREALTQMTQTPFDFTEPPLWRTLLYVTGTEHVLFVVFHHLIVDGFSVGLFIDEFMRVLTKKELPVIERDFFNFVHVKDYNYRYNKKAEPFWKDEFSKGIKRFQLPTDFGRKDIQTYNAKTKHHHLDSELFSKIQKYGKLNKVSLHTLFHSAFSILFYKLTKEEGISIGTSVLGRDESEYYNAIGMFMETVPVVTYPLENMKIADYIREVKSKIMACISNTGYHFYEYLTENSTSKAEGFDPHYSVILSYMNFGELHGITGSENHENLVATIKTEYDLYIYVYETKNDLYIVSKYKKELFKRETIDKWLESVDIILEKITGDDSITVGALL